MVMRLLVAALLVPLLAHATPEEDVSRVADGFASAVGSAQLDDAVALCGEPLLTRARPDCAALVQKLIDGESTLTPAGVAVGGKKAVVLYWIREERHLTPVWLVAQLAPDGWKLVQFGVQDSPPSVSFRVPDHGPLLPAGMTTMPPHVVAMADAINSGDIGRLAPHCAPAIQGERGACAELTSEVAKGHTTFRVIGLEEQEGRQLVRLVAVVDRTDRDRVFLFLEPRGEGWQIVGINDRETLARDVLAGRLPAAIGPDTLVDDAIAAALFEAMRDVAMGRRTATDAQLLPGSTTLSQAWLGDPRPVELGLGWARVVKGTDRQVVCFDVEGTRQMAVWRRVGEGWKLLDSRYGCDVSIDALTDWEE
jgi:hypothetical protein